MVDKVGLLSFEEFKKQYEAQFRDYLFIKYNHSIKIKQVESDTVSLISLLQQTIERAKQQNLYYEGQLGMIDFFGEDGEQLKARIKSEIRRHASYLQDLQAQLAKAQTLAHLLSLSATELFIEAKKNRSSALLIVNTPDLITRLSLAQMEHITHQDNEIIKKLATLIASEEYTLETANLYKDFTELASTDEVKEFIVAKENTAIRALLLKINTYLDKKIKSNGKTDTYPWSLGYFGSNNKVTADDKIIAVPQGISEIKSHLALIDTIPPLEILKKIKAIIKTKQDEIHDESFFAQVKRFISFVFGYHRSENTIKEYEVLDKFTLGMPT